MINFQNWINPSQFSNLNNISGFDEKTGMQNLYDSKGVGGSGGGVATSAIMGAIEGAGTDIGALGGAIAGAKAPFQKAFDNAQTKFDTAKAKFDTFNTKVGDAAQRMGFDYTSNLDKIEGQ
jgi:hypothetical protein